MNRRPLSMWSVLLLLGAPFAFVPGVLAQSGAAAGLEKQMSTEEFKAAGLDKLIPFA